MKTLEIRTPNAGRKLKARLVATILTGETELPSGKIGLTQVHPMNDCILMMDKPVNNKRLPKPVNLDDVRAFRDKIAQVASEDTAFADYDRSIDPMHNHCKAASFVVQQKFGGVILYAKIDGDAHYWNLLPCGTEVDVTATQYDAPYKGDGVNPVAVATHVLPWRDPKKANRRFRLLAKRVDELG